MAKRKKTLIPFLTCMRTDACLKAMPSIHEWAAEGSLFAVHELLAWWCINAGPKKRTASRKKVTGKEAYTAIRVPGKPSKKQTHKLSMFAGSGRFLWNRMVADYKADLDAKRKPVIKTPAQYKKEKDLEWLRESDSLALCNVQLAFQGAIHDFYAGGKGFPKFHKKHKHTDSYTTNMVNGNIKLEGNCLTLPGIPGKIKLIMHRYPDEAWSLKTVTVTHESNGRWYFSLKFQYEAPEATFDDSIEEYLGKGDASVLRHVGLDMSLPFLYVDSEGNTPSYGNNGNTITFSKAYRKLESRIAREQRKLSHMVKDSKNYARQLQKIARLHAKAKHQRQDFLQQMSVRLVRENDIISIEDLDIAGLKKALKFGKSVSDNGWGGFVDMLYRKSQKYGSLVIKIDRWFPSSKKCSVCGHVHKELSLEDRTYACPECGNVMDRDEQAAHNIDMEGLRIFTEFVKERKGSSQADACKNTVNKNRWNTGVRLFYYGVHTKPSGNVS